MTLADECAARVHDRARQAAARITNREEAMTTQETKPCPHCGQTGAQGREQEEA